MSEIRDFYFEMKILEFGGSFRPPFLILMSQIRDFYLKMKNVVIWRIIHTSIFNFDVPNPGFLFTPFLIWNALWFIAMETSENVENKTMALYQKIIIFSDYI